MRAAIRDVQEWVQANYGLGSNAARVVDVNQLNAYLLAMLITAGAYDDLTDGEPDDGQG